MSEPIETTELTEKDANHLPAFFAVVTPGLEILAAKELLSCFPETEIEVERGGFTFYAELTQGCELNRVLKIPTRILLRLTSFTCRDFPKLFKKTMAFPWEKFVPAGGLVEFQASSTASRLFVKKRIEETCLDGFKKHVRKGSSSKHVKGSAVAQVAATNPETSSLAKPPVSPITVLVRLDDNICTFSLDTSGEILHKRGTRTFASEAPIRETIASALLFWMIAKAEDENAGAKFVSAEKRSVTLVDPMMGAGTFFLEAAQLTETVVGRDFAFEKFPSEAGTAMDKVESKLKNPFTNFFGLDLDPKAIAATTGNLRPLIQSLRPTQSISALQGDIFSAPALEGAETRWLIANPPYGERLRIEGPLKDYYEALFEACEKFARPEWSCFVLPETAKPLKLKLPRAWKLNDSLRFQNGGIPVTAVLYRRRDS